MGELSIYLGKEKTDFVWINEYFGSFCQEPTFLNNYTKTGIVSLVMGAVCDQLWPPAGLHGAAVPNVALEARHGPLRHAQQARDKNWNGENWKNESQLGYLRFLAIIVLIFLVGT